MKLAPTDPILASITERDVAFYLSQKGWEKADYPRPELLVFDGPALAGGQPIKAVKTRAGPLRRKRPSPQR